VDGTSNPAVPGAAADFKDVSMSAFAGWLAQRYRVNRPLSDAERNADVRNFDGMVKDPIDQGIIALNPTFIEYVDRHFHYRGWGAMWGLLVIALAVAFAVAMAMSPTVTPQGFPRPPTTGERFVVGWIVTLSSGLAAFSYWMLLGKDVFRYQYYPIRFNRKTRRVHVFTGGRHTARSASWDEVRFIIGCGAPPGADDKGTTYDLRGHLMQGDQVIYTFAVGSDSGPNPGPTLAHWEMIRRYMEGGMDALPFPPLHLYTSTTPSLRNAVIIHVSSAGAGLGLLFLPITLPWAMFRYLSMKLCRRPAWPRAVEDDCADGSKAGSLREPVVYGRVGDGHGSETMLAYWKQATGDAMALNETLRTRMKANGGH